MWTSIEFNTRLSANQTLFLLFTSRVPGVKSKTARLYVHVVKSVARDVNRVTSPSYKDGGRCIFCFRSVRCRRVGPLTAKEYLLDALTDIQWPHVLFDHAGWWLDPRWASHAFHQALIRHRDAFVFYLCHNLVYINEKSNYHKWSKRHINSFHLTYPTCGYDVTSS